MNYAWEAALQAEKAGMGRDNLRFVEAVSPSPYIEVSMIDLNLFAPEENRIELNPLYRFENLFGKLFDKNIEEMARARELFFDICMHYIIQMDLREGLTKEDYYCDMVAKDIRRGCYGKQAGIRFGLFSKEEQKKILCAYIHLLMSGNYLEEFRKVMTRLYSDVFIYENNETTHELLVYLGVRETDQERERAAFLIELFLPMQETVHLFYERHFGIIGVDETMAADEMVIF